MPCVVLLPPCSALARLAHVFLTEVAHGSWVTARFPFPCPLLLLTACCVRDGGGGRIGQRLERGRAEQRAVGQGLKARPGGGSIGGGRAPAGEWARAAAGAREGGGGGAAAQAQVPRGRGGRRARQAQDADLLPCLQQCTAY
ncbi:hypothetical protein DAI22_12g106901 [Oryza sativa Japonica Group]|nr:hypothetical protein DAI22_12g106901 [Oryza sativa Japonica Group]